MKTLAEIGVWVQAPGGGAFARVRGCYLRKNFEIECARSYNL